MAFGAEASVAVLKSVASLASERVSDRDERAAFKLIQVARPHLEFAGRHPAAFDLQRTHAEALCEIGHPEVAKWLLRGLSEARRSRPSARLPRRQRCFCSGHRRWRAMSRRPTKDSANWRHAWPSRPPMTRCSCTCSAGTTGCGGQDRRVSESASGYDSVIDDRSRRLGHDHADSLDARHSKGKMLVANGAGTQASVILRAVAEDRARVQGDRHSDTLETVKYFHLARVQEEPHDDRSWPRGHRPGGDLHNQVSRHGQDYPMCRDTVLARLASPEPEPPASRSDPKRIPGSRQTPPTHRKVVTQS